MDWFLNDNDLGHERVKYKNQAWVFSIRFCTLILFQCEFLFSSRLHEKKISRLRLSQPVPRLTRMILIFINMRSFVLVFRYENVRWCIILSLVQFDFSYSSAIITLNLGFILGLSISKFSPIKNSIKAHHLKKIFPLPLL